MEQNSDTTSALVELAETLKLSLPDDIVDAAVADGDLTVTVQRPSIVKVLKFLRDDANCQFSQLVDLCGVDFPEREERFEVVYHLLSMNQNLRARLKVQPAKTPQFLRSHPCFHAQIGLNAKSGTCTACSFRIIPTYAVS